MTLLFTVINKQIEKRNSELAFELKITYGIFLAIVAITILEYTAYNH